MKLVTQYLPESWLRALDKLVPKQYPSRAEAIRIAVRDLLHAHNEFPKLDTLTPTIMAAVNMKRVEGKKKEAT